MSFQGSPFAKTPKKYEKLKEYSPFKHSPRKNHKIHSPRTSSKKDRSDSVPQTPTKKESESNEDERRSNSIKKERAKSDECDSSSKREREISSSKKSECSSHHQSSDHSSAKKERKDSHESNHRKEVKNLETEFDSKRSKSKSGKSDKCGHDGRRSDEGKSESSSRHKRHDDSKGKFHSKHERSSSHKKSESVSNGPVAEKEEKHEKNTPLKRKNSDTQGPYPVKKAKEEDLQKDNINGKDVNESAAAAETKSELAACANSGVNIADVLSVKVDSSGLISEPQESESIPIDVLPSVKCETNESNTGSAFTQETEQTDVLCQAECNDLRHSSTFGSLSADINPPLPCSSPPSNPPLPPNSPLSDVSHCAAAESSEAHSREEPATFASPANEDEKHRELQDQCNVSKDVIQGKKVKKKIVKKAKEEGECYDLLGDIMSQMDKKK